MISKYYPRRALLVALAVAGLSSGAALSAEPNDIVFFFNGTTESNREGLNYVKKAFAQDRLGYGLKFTQNPKDIVPGKFKAVVVFNTNVTQRGDIDPKLAAFVADYPAKKEVLVLTLVKNSQSVAVEHLPPTDKAPQVDVITAATLWPNLVFGGANGFSRDQIMVMHDQWFKKFTAWLKGLK